MMWKMWLPLAIACVLWAPSYGRAAAPQVATCAAGQGGQAPVVAFKMASLGSVTVRCNEANHLANQGAANGGNGNIYTSSAAQNPVQLHTVLPGATYTNQAQSNFTVAQLPTKDTSIFFRCNVANNNEAIACWIEVQVPAQPPLGPQGCAVAGSQVTLTVSKAGDKALFTCTGDSKMFPQDPKKAFGADCKTELVLADQLKDSSFVHGGQGAMSTLTIPHMPKDALKLCFFCGANANSADAERCIIRVEVAGGTPGSATGLTARTASIMGAFLVGVALYRNT